MPRYRNEEVRLPGGFITLRRVGGEVRGGEQRPSNSAAAYFVDNQQGFVQASADLSEQPQSHRRGHHFHYHPSDHDGNSYYGQNTHQRPDFAYNIQDYAYAAPLAPDDQPLRHRHRHRHHHHDNEPRPRNHYHQHYHHQHHHHDPTRHHHHHHHDLNRHHQNQNFRHTQVQQPQPHQPQAQQQEQQQPSPPPPQPADQATGRAILLVPTPDGSWVAHPANYWQNTQQAGHGQSSGTGDSVH